MQYLDSVDNQEKELTQTGNELLSLNKMASPPQVRRRHSRSNLEDNSAADQTATLAISSKAGTTESKQRLVLKEGERNTELAGIIERSPGKSIRSPSPTHSCGGSSVHNRSKIKMWDDGNKGNNTEDSKGICRASPSKRITRLAKTASEMDFLPAQINESVTQRDIDCEKENEKIADTFHDIKTSQAKSSPMNGNSKKSASADLPQNMKDRHETGFEVRDNKEWVSIPSQDFFSVASSADKNIDDTDFLDCGKHKNKHELPDCVADAFSDVDISFGEQTSKNKQKSVIGARTRSTNQKQYQRPGTDTFGDNDVREPLKQTRRLLKQNPPLARKFSRVAQAYTDGSHLEC